ncbi:MAG: hypothetical protein ACFFAS_01730 [Promethearchaeota archaeon]
MPDSTSVLLYIKQMLGDLIYINGIIATELINITENTAAMRHGEEFLNNSQCRPEHDQLKKNIINIVKTYKRTPEEFLKVLDKHVLKHLEEPND